MDQQANKGNNYYLIRAIVIGARGTQKTTFINRVLHGKPESKEDDISSTQYKEYHNIGGKLKVKIEVSDMPKEIMYFTAGYFKSKAILFIFFDLTRPDTFYANDRE